MKKLIYAFAFVFIPLMAVMFFAYHSWNGGTDVASKLEQSSDRAPATEMPSVP
ncbi:MAG TPA: hypothetical protein VI754_17150 [Bacteriovoracaceae bacterium]|nr:hypothetical protein [Bacteriovoracaceae bacterium]